MNIGWRVPYLIYWLQNWGVRAGILKIVQERLIAQRFPYRKHYVHRLYPDQQTIYFPNGGAEPDRCDTPLSFANKRHEQGTASQDLTAHDDSGDHHLIVFSMDRLIPVYHYGRHAAELSSRGRIDSRVDGLVDAARHALTHAINPTGRR